MEPQSDWATALPAPALRAFIESYRGYRMTGFDPGLHRGLPSRHLTFIVSIGPPIDVVAHPEGSPTRPDRFRCVLSGLQPSEALIRHTGHQEGVAIELTPLGCRALFGLPTAALWNTSIELAEVAGRAGDELWERLQAVESWDARFAVCNDVLTRLLRDDGAVAVTVAPELTVAWHAIVRSGGGVAITDLAEEVGWSRQHLRRRFADEFGLSPKLAARIVRFERARLMLQSVPSFVTIAQVAAACGYYDQAHLNRDFAELAGCPPRVWLDDEVPNFQYDDAAGM